MQPLSFDEFEALSPAYDDVVDTAPVPDRFCTASDWILPALRAFSGQPEPWVYRFDAGWAPLMRLRTVLGRTLMPLEASWGLASPLVGPDPGAVAVRLLEVSLDRRAEWDALFLSGLERDGPAFHALVRRLGRRWRLGLGQPTVRCVASLEGGFDGFLGRRSPKLRKALRQAERRADGLRFEVLPDLPATRADEVLARVTDVEARSWKGREGLGIDRGPMRDFYELMIPRLARRGGLRLTLAWSGDVPVGYVLGGVRGDTYRGLQISFDQDLSELSLGNLLQLHTVRGLCEEGVLRYDLGTDMPYKRRWAEAAVETVPLVIR